MVGEDSARRRFFRGMGAFVELTRLRSVPGSQVGGRAASIRVGTLTSAECLFTRSASPIAHGRPKSVVNCVFTVRRLSSSVRMRWPSRRRSCSYWSSTVLSVGFTASAPAAPGARVAGSGAPAVARKSAVVEMVVSPASLTSPLYTASSTMWSPGSKTFAVSLLPEKTVAAMNPSPPTGSWLTT